MYSVTYEHKNSKMMDLMIAAVGAAVAFVVLFSAIFITLETFHDCDGENCPICEMLQLCEENIDQLCDGSLFIAIVAPIMLLLAGSISVSLDVFLRPTPVTNMVRMNN